MIFNCSTIEPGHPCVMITGNAFGCFERTWMKCMSTPSIWVMNCGRALSHGDRSSYEKCDSCPDALHGFSSRSRRLPYDRLARPDIPLDEGIADTFAAALATDTKVSPTPSCNCPLLSALVA